MSSPVSVRLDDQIQATLEAAAKEKGIGLSTYLRDLASEEARRIRKARIRAQSESVGQYAASSTEGAAFYADWGTPPTAKAP
jgi:hypothetical protein